MLHAEYLYLPLQELKEIIPKILTPANPQLPDSLIEFNYAQGKFLLLPSPGNMVVVYESQGTLIAKDSQEARQQMIEQGLDRKHLLFLT